MQSSGKAFKCSFIKDCGMVTEVRFWQFLNTPYPMLVTELGMVIEVRPLQP